jgi:uncharacterized protein YidB (DUF937 family)
MPVIIIQEKNNMGILDSVMKNPEMMGDVAKFAMENPEIAKAAMSMFSASEGSEGGLGGIVSSLQSGGLGDAVTSWLGSGANEAIDPSKLSEALGSDKMSKFAEQAGVNGSEASALLAGVLPQIVDKLSPDGNLPDAGSLDSMIGGLLGSLGK